MELMLKINAWTCLLVSAYLTVCHAPVQKPEITTTDSPGLATQPLSPLSLYHCWEGDFWAHSVGDGLVAGK